MATFRVSHSSAPDGWNVKKSGRVTRSGIGTKQEAVNLARAQAEQGDNLVVERRNGTEQKNVEITSTNEDRLSMNRGNFDVFG